MQKYTTGNLLRSFYLNFIVLVLLFCIGLAGISCGGGSNNPGSGNNNPGGGSNSPGGGNNNPGGGSNSPGGGSNNPGSGDPTPTPGPSAPTSLSYESPQLFIVGIEIDPLTPTVSGNVTSYTVSPILPEGLSLDTATGRISGIPVFSITTTIYRITASNSAGSTYYDLSITIVNEADDEPEDPLTTLTAWGDDVPDWNTFQGNSAHTGYVPVEIDHRQFLTRWKISSGAGSASGMANIAVVNGRLYVSNSSLTGESLSAYDEYDGTRIWRRDFNGLKNPCSNPPAVEDGIVYMVAGQQDTTGMYAFDANDGTLLFKAPMSSQWERYQSPTLGLKGIYTNGGAYGGLYAFDRAGQTLFPFKKLEQLDQWTPAVDEYGVYAYTGGYLRVFHPSTGALLHEIFNPYANGSACGSPIVGAEGSIFVANCKRGDNMLLHFNLYEDVMDWQVSGSYRGTPAYHDDVLYITNNDPFQFEARDEINGTLLWQWIPPKISDSAFFGEVLLTKNLVFVSTDKMVYAIDIDSRKEVWSYPMSGHLALSKNGILYIQNETMLVAINAKEGDASPKPVYTAPGSLSYGGPKIYVTGIESVPLDPVVSGNPISFNVTPELPRGLFLNTATGQISGTPTTLSGTVIYRITASNDAGYTQCDISITVVGPTTYWPGNNLSLLTAWSDDVPDWGTFQGNSAHTGYVPVELDHRQFSTRWRKASGVGSISGMANFAASNGRIFVSSFHRTTGDNTLSSYDEYDGARIWSYDFSGLRYPSANPPMVDNGVIYLVAGQQSATGLYALNATDGSLHFSAPMSSQWENFLAPTSGPEGIYTNGGTYGGMYAFDHVGQALFPFKQLEQFDLWTPAVDEYGVYAYTGRYLRAFHPSTGALLHEILNPAMKYTNGTVYGSPVVGAAGSIFAADYSPFNRSDNNTLLHFNLNENAIDWQVYGEYAGTPAYRDNVLYIANNNPFQLEARNETSGALLWKWMPPLISDRIFVGEVLLTNNLVFVSTDKMVYAIDVNSHKEAWSYPMSGHLALSKNGILYIQNETMLTAINVKQ